MPDLTMSLNGRPVSVTISVKAVQGASLAHLVNHKGLTWTFWKEVSAYPHPWLLLKLPRPWGWWVAWMGADMDHVEDWAGRHANIWGLTPHGRAILFADHDRVVVAQPLTDVLAWLTPEHLVQAWE